MTFAGAANAWLTDPRTGRDPPAAANTASSSVISQNGSKKTNVDCHGGRGWFVPPHAPRENRPFPWRLRDLSLNMLAGVLLAAAVEVAVQGSIIVVCTFAVQLVAVIHGVRAIAVRYGPEATSISFRAG